ncbi:probable phospholipid-transporting ATPase IF isoform X1 [Tetranychus urticae]|uniref:probable phospholipid-transporting ATPase IF isoform X1 n=1 Tax=Tetranychus urticae TaxID=32264 RepID=UPI00077BC408|nr:probable phospholipid-transporting ATPase IF isoform X1 [Tetranychus urticae]
MVVKSNHHRSNRSIPINWRNVICRSDQISAGNSHRNKISTRKYTWFSFIPRNLFEQFHRLANFYFLVLSILQLVFAGPFSPTTSILPLLFVIGTTAIKQAYEDALRQKSDLLVNLRKIPVLVGQQFKRIRSENIITGDIVKLRSHHEIPCDLVFISFTNEPVKAGIITANLDGETNLKVKDSIPLPGDVIGKKEATIDFHWETLNGTIIVEEPHEDLYEFVGVLKMGPLNVSLGPNNLLLRGSRLVSPDHVYGIAVYVGVETKMALNSKIKANKFTSIERRVNVYLVGYFIILFLMTTVSYILSKTHSILLDADENDFWYLADYLSSPDLKISKEAIGDYFSFFILYSFLIPISLYVSLSLVKLIGTYSLINDRSLINPETFDRPIVNTSDLNEELGQIEYLFSDKTGTLTQNVMNFKCASIDGEIIELSSDDSSFNLISSLTGKKAEKVKDFFVSLCICNSVRVKKPTVTVSPPKDDGLDYIEPTGTSKESISFNIGWEGDSPDETALVEAAARFDVVLEDSDEKFCDIVVNNVRSRYQKLNIFPFDSDRKRMSILVKSETGEIIWICKGAENVMKQLTSKGKIKETYRHVEDMSKRGMRTLIVVSKKLSADEYQSFAGEFKDASLSLHKRKEKMESVMANHETNFRIIGATGVEDLLQEGVGDTIAALRQAGIKVWILTGDKTETAVNVAYSVSLLDKSIIMFNLTNYHDTETCSNSINIYLNRIAATLHGTEVSPESNQFACIVDGKTLFLAMKHLKSSFCQLCLQCSAVVCARMSPIQKAEVVRMIKNCESRPVTAAIGDGANDVSMIQEADIGFGLIGKEGRQACNSSDLAFAKFRFLKRIVLIHGHYYYIRVTNLIQYFFYKNSTLVTPLLYYSFDNIFSAQTIFHGILLMLFNMMFTAFPVLIYSIIEKNIPESLLEKEPRFYWLNHRNHNMNSRKYLTWLAFGIFHGSICFLTIKYLYLNNEDIVDNKAGGIIIFGNMSFMVMVCVVNFKLLLMARINGYLLPGSVILSNFLVHYFYYVFSQRHWDFYFVDDALFGSYLQIVQEPVFWLVFLLTLVISLIHECIIMEWKRAFTPTIKDKMVL